MKRGILFVVFCAIFLLPSFKNEDASVKSKTYSIDLKQKANADSISSFLSNTKIRLLPLELDESRHFIGDEPTVHVADDGSLFLLDISQYTIFHFGKDGKFLNKIYRKGDGLEEYSTLLDIVVSDDKIYILDRKKIVVCDYDGNYIKTIPLKSEGRQMALTEDGCILVTSNYIQKYQLTVYYPDGHVSEHLPSADNLLNQQISQSTYHSMKLYDGNVFFTNYLDMSIYQFGKKSLSVFAKIKFKDLGLPTNLLKGTTETVADRILREYRENDLAVLSIDNLTITDDWLVFVPVLMLNPCVVYYNRHTNHYFINRDFRGFYQSLLGGYKAPDGYLENTSEFYRLVDVEDVKKMVKEVDSDGLKDHPFLKDVNTLDDSVNTNKWIVFFTLPS